VAPAAYHFPIFEKITEKVTFKISNFVGQISISIPLYVSEKGFRLSSSLLEKASSRIGVYQGRVLALMSIQTALC